MKPSGAVTLGRDRTRAEVVDDLRRLLVKVERGTVQARVFSFGLPVLDGHLPEGGLASGAVHEVTPEADGDSPAAFGFVAAFLGRIPQGGPVLLVTSPRRHDDGSLHGHGLTALGLDPARVILVEARRKPEAFWAVEEALRSTVPAAVAGAIGAEIEFKTSQRLNLAARDSGVPLILLRPAGAEESIAAATRWRIGARNAVRDRFGLIARWRWCVRLERCRNGRPGEWLVEWDHVARRFSLASSMADLALPHGASAQPLAAGAGRS
jgi:protein ImuA